MYYATYRKGISPEAKTRKGESIVFSRKISGKNNKDFDSFGGTAVHLKPLWIKETTQTSNQLSLMGMLSQWANRLGKLSQVMGPKCP